MIKSSPEPIHWRIPAWFSDLSVDQLNKLKMFHVELLKFNPRVNLVSPKSLADGDRTHFADSILMWQLIAPEIPVGASVFDFGSGNGFPGLVAALLSAEIQVCSVEVDVRKCEFIKHAASTLGLSNLKVLNQRVESIDPDSVFFGMSRGFASISRSCEWTRTAFKKNGRYFHMKSADWKRELDEMSEELLVSWNVKMAGRYTLPDSGVSYYVIETARK